MTTPASTEPRSPSSHRAPDRPTRLNSHSVAVWWVTFLLAVPVTLYALAAVVFGERVPEHREWMLRSYALIFAAVTFRIELPLLIFAFDAFPPRIAPPPGCAGC